MHVKKYLFTTDLSVPRKISKLGAVISQIQKKNRTRFIINTLAIWAKYPKMKKQRSITPTFSRYPQTCRFIIFRNSMNEMYQVCMEWAFWERSTKLPFVEPIVLVLLSAENILFDGDFRGR